MSKIINTRADLDELAASDPQAHAAFIAKLKGSLTQTVDTREYPPDHDHSLRPGDPGYLAPVIVEVADDTAATRLGFTSAEVLDL